MLLLDVDVSAVALLTNCWQGTNAAARRKPVFWSKPMAGFACCALMVVPAGVLASPTSFLLGDGSAQYVKPLDFVLARDRVYVVYSKQYWGTGDDKMRSFAGGPVALEVRTTSGKLVSTLDLQAELGTEVEDAPTPAYMVEHRGGLTILVGDFDPVLGRLSYQGAIEAKVAVRDLAGDTRSLRSGGPVPIGLERQGRHVAAVFNDRLLVLDEKLQVLAQWQPAHGITDAGAGDELLWVVEAGPGENAAGGGDFIGSLVALAVGDEISERMRVRIPGELRGLPKVLSPWPDEAVVLLAQGQTLRSCSFRRNAERPECATLDTGDAPGTVAVATPFLQTIEIDGSSYGLALASTCGVWQRSFDKRHQPASRELVFPSVAGGVALDDVRNGYLLDLLLKTYAGEHYALMSLETATGPEASRVATYFVRAQVADRRRSNIDWFESCPDWNNETFFITESAGRVAACLEAGADANGGGRCGGALRPLTQAATVAGADVVAALLAAGAEATGTDRWGVTALHEAAASPRQDARRILGVLDALIDAGANVNAKNADGRTPLHYAATHSRLPSAVIALLDAGADPKAKDEVGRTPWDYAQDNEALPKETLAPLRPAQ